MGFGEAEGHACVEGFCGVGLGGGCGCGDGSRTVLGYDDVDLRRETCLFMSVDI